MNNTKYSVKKVKKEDVKLLSSYAIVMGKKKRSTTAVNVEVQQSLESGINLR